MTTVDIRAQWNLLGCCRRRGSGHHGLGAWLHSGWRWYGRARRAAFEFSDTLFQLVYASQQSADELGWIVRVGCLRANQTL